MKEIIVRMTSDHIKVKGGEYVRDCIDGDKLADSIHTDLCYDLKCDSCPFRTEDNGCRIEEWLDSYEEVDNEQMD